MNSSNYFSAMYLFIRDSFICLFIAAGVGAVISYPLCFLALPTAFIFSFVLVFLIIFFLLRRGIIPGFVALYDLLFRRFKKEELLFTGIAKQFSVYAACFKKERINPSLTYHIMSFLKHDGKELSLLYSQEDILRLNTCYFVTYAYHSRIIISIAAIDDVECKPPASVSRSKKPIRADNISLKNLNKNK